MSWGHAGEHMLSWSPRADIEDEERQYFKANVFPEVRLPQSIRRGVLTSLPWTTKCWDLHAQKNAKGRLTKCSLPTEIPQTVNGTGHAVFTPPLPKSGSFHQISLEEMHNHTCYSTRTCGCARSCNCTLWCHSWAEDGGTLKTIHFSANNLLCSVLCNYWKEAVTMGDNVVQQIRTSTI